MPLKIPDSLPAKGVLQQENIFCISDTAAAAQDIRPLNLLLLNLMPQKIETEIQLMRMLANSPLQVNIELLRIHKKPSSHTPNTHMDAFYKSFDQVKQHNYDGMIITGAPLGKTQFSEVSFWPTLQKIMDWSTAHVTSTLYLCWAVQAAMFHFYGINKRIMSDKLSGVFSHYVEQPLSPIVRGFDSEFKAPHSRHAEVPRAAIEQHNDLQIIASSSCAGPYISKRKDGRQLFVTGHAEYDALSLKREYQRDRQAGLKPALPQNYFPQNDPMQTPVLNWNSHGNLLFANWLNYYVYQLTPYNRDDISPIVFTNTKPA